MKKTIVLLGVVCSLLINFKGIAQENKPGKNEAKKEQKEADKSAKKAAKAETKAAKDAISTADEKAAKEQAKVEKKAGKVENSGLKDDKLSKLTVDKALKEEKATPADYKAPVDKNTKGPDGATVYVGPRGGKYYINKKGNKAYLNSPKK
ncbi:hypothetical protein [Spirosoma oryzicola]|uniref:hypothetical protein n=1 Tax=Spirosoma oryzicola TaxID=2898794 RepID=UPI001E2EFF2B|nr:hypothetical protein [Spirosoma oryzicola]UHG92641.1 hypothetical protein LQ777_06980 [Spirosoma oryzicola]